MHEIKIIENKTSRLKIEITQKDRYGSMFRLCSDGFVLFSQYIFPQNYLSFITQLKQVIEILEENWEAYNLNQQNVMLDPDFYC